MDNLQHERDIYLAAVLDCDGSITLLKQRNTAAPRVIVTNTDEEFIHRLQSEFGGNIHRQGLRNLRCRRVWYWYLYGKEAIILLRRVRTWLRIKREQANVVIECWEQTYEDYTPHRGRRTPDAVIEARSQFMSRIRVLNKRGAA